MEIFASWLTENQCWRCLWSYKSHLQSRGCHHRPMGAIGNGNCNKELCTLPCYCSSFSGKGVHCLANMGWNRIVIESDCQFLVCTFRWTPMTCNHPAHLVAQMHHWNNLPSDWMFKPPIPLARALVQDARCIPSRRGSWKCKEIKQPCDVRHQSFGRRREIGALLREEYGCLW